ncbi:MAG TPA: hypothetical protein VIY48_00685, partial [Candidatus Paceibacterota bacterium]
MTGANPLTALFQSLQSGQAQPPDPQQTPNPALAQMMNPQAAQPTMAAPPPDLAPAPPAIPGPTAPPTIPLDAQIQALTQQVSDNVKKLQEPIQSQIPPELADFNKYNEAK